jgi:hypothetical protein
VLSKRTSGSLRASTPGAALDRIIHWLNSNNKRASLAAATLLLDRAWGKVDTGIDAKTDTTATRVTVIPAPSVAEGTNAWREQHGPPNTG